MNRRILNIIILFSLLQIVYTGPIASGVCIQACNAGVVMCYASLGYVFGTVTAGVGTPAGIIACNAAQGVCMTGCAALLAAPTP